MICKLSFYCFIYFYINVVLICYYYLIISDRTKPLEKGDSLSARLIRVMTSVLLPNLKDNISELLFTLCDEDG
jgi:hypothetical protein